VPLLYRELPELSGIFHPESDNPEKQPTNNTVLWSGIALESSSSDGSKISVEINNESARYFISWKNVYHSISPWKTCVKNFANIQVKKAMIHEASQIVKLLLIFLFKVFSSTQPQVGYFFREKHTSTRERVLLEVIRTIASVWTCNVVINGCSSPRHIERGLPNRKIVSNARVFTYNTGSVILYNNYPRDDNLNYKNIVHAGVIPPKAFSQPGLEEFFIPDPKTVHAVIQLLNVNGSNHLIVLEIPLSSDDNYTSSKLLHSDGQQQYVNTSENPLFKKIQTFGISGHKVKEHEIHFEIDFQTLIAYQIPRNMWKKSHLEGLKIYFGTYEYHLPKSTYGSAVKFCKAQLGTYKATFSEDGRIKRIESKTIGRVVYSNDKL